MVWFALATCAIAVLVTARVLVPDPHGHGTHMQLGLPPCGFMVYFGYPCPGCGMTTSFAHLARAEMVSAFVANPFGLLLFAATIAFIPVALIAGVRGDPVVATLDRIRADRVAMFLAVSSIAIWVVRVLLQYFAH